MRALRYHRPASIAEAQAAFADPANEAMLLAGGTTLLDLAKLDVLRPAVLIDTKPLAAGRRAITTGTDSLHLGAFATMAEVEQHPDVRRLYPVISEALGLSASPQIRHMATLGGNLLQRTRCSYYRDPSWIACNRRTPGTGCQAITGVARSHAVLGTSDACLAIYAGDLAQALVALDASIVLEGETGLRTVPLLGFHRLPQDQPQIETQLGRGEVITAILVPFRPWFARSTYVKLRDRASYEFAIASAAVALDLKGDHIRDVRIALGGVATVPWRATEAEDFLRGNSFDEATLSDGARRAFAVAEPRPETAYKIELGQRVIVEALLQAARKDIAHG